MSKFTAGIDLDLKWNGNDLSGPAGTEFRIPDALYDEFNDAYAGLIPGLTWTVIDELGTISTPAHSSLTGVTANQHHSQVHSISGSDHTGTLAHSALGSITATDHHAAPAAGPDADVTIDSAGAAGTASTFARSGHGHKIATSSSTPTDVGSPTASAGTSGTAPARGNHRHAPAQGTSFPGSPATNELFFRTDLGLDFFYNGTRWLSVQLFKTDFVPNASAAIGGLSATQADAYAVGVHVTPGSDLWLEQYVTQFFVVGGGSALSASHKWVGDMHKRDSAASNTTLSTTTIDSGSSGAFRTNSQTINALLSATYFWLSTTWTKTGTPGNLLSQSYLTYRIVAS